MYHNVRQLHRLGVSQRAIASALGVSRKTVKRYLDMGEEAFAQPEQRPKAKPALLDQYEDFIVRRLREAPAASTAQVHDWLKESFPDFGTVSAKTVYNYVMRIRQRYALPLETVTRAMMMQPELAYGKQAQVDFGVYVLGCGGKSRKRVYFFSMMLSASRMKYVYFQDKPFTTPTTIEAHERAFAFFGGIPEQVVFDQDRVLLVNENLGELMLTREFKAYVEAHKFALFFCRKSDPQSKGKVENVIGYVKKNFLYGRTYFNAEVLQTEALQWLERTGNGTAHTVTGHKPAVLWEQEVKQLRPYRPIAVAPRWVAHKVRKDNMITFKGNYYSVPYGTYKKGVQVLVAREDGLLLVQDQKGKLLCRHKIPGTRNNKVFNNNHRRDNSIKIGDLKDKVANCFQDRAAARLYLDEVHKAFPRYVRDQLTAISKLIHDQDARLVNEALQQCVAEKRYRHSAFREALEALIAGHQGPERPASRIVPMISAKSREKAAAQPEKTSIDRYESLFKLSK